jgi:hypothetical protein
MSNETTHADNEHRVIPIFVDDVKFELTESHQAGAQLRQLANVAADRDLWLEIPVNKDDVLVRPDTSLEVKPGTHFYTAPSTINPGDC